jgi:hypothetical protein
VILFLPLTRDRWAWQRQCDAGVLPVWGVLSEVSFQPVPVTCSPRLPLPETTIFTAAMAILDTKNASSAEFVGRIDRRQNGDSGAKEPKKGTSSVVTVSVTRWNQVR